MKSKIVFICLLMFCLSMTSWLFYSVYFRKDLFQEEVPFSIILRKFLREAADITTLHVYHHETKLGFASVNTRPVNVNQKDDYFVLVSGFLQKGVIPNVEDDTMWRVDFRIDNYEVWNGSTGQVRMPKLGNTFDFKWMKGEKLPTFQLKQSGVVLADEKMLGPLISQNLGLMQMSQAGIDPQTLTMEQSTHMGSLEIAGQKRRGYFWELFIAKRWKVRAFFTEAGQLAVVDFPNGYRLLEPIMYGLVPDYTEEEEISDEEFLKLKEMGQ